MVRVQLGSAFIAAAVLSVGCSRRAADPPHASVAAASTPEAQFTAWARTRVTGEPRVTAISGDPVPRTACFEARGTQPEPRVVGCVHPSAGVLSGREGFAAWLRTRGFRVDSPATGPELMFQAFDTLTGRTGYRVERAWNRILGGALAVSADGAEGERRFARSLEIREEGAAAEGPTALVPEEVVPTGEGITRFRDSLGARAAEMQAWQRVAELSLGGLTCYQGTPGSGDGGARGPSIGCMRGTELLTGSQALGAYLRERRFTPAEPGMTPGKLLSMANAMTGEWTGFGFSNVTSTVTRTGDLQVVATASRTGTGGRGYERVLTVAADATVHDGWRTPENPAVVSGAPPVEPPVRAPGQ